MPLGVQGGDVVFHNGTIAAVAFGGEHFEIVVAAVRFAVTFMEAIFAKLLAALGTEEMLCMPGLIQSRNTFLKQQTTRSGELNHNSGLA